MFTVNNILLNEAIELNGPDLLTASFSKSLSSVFSSTYLSRMEKIINKIKIKESITNNNIIAWFDGSTIYVNKRSFYAIPASNRVNYLLHEFTHYLMNKKFKEVSNLSKQIERIVVTDTNGDYSKIASFLIGKSGGTISKNLINSQEYLAYFMNGKINWSALSEKAVLLIKKQIMTSGIFNTSSPFWTKEGRLGSN